jgi:hypothetical protein
MVRERAYRSTMTHAAERRATPMGVGLGPIAVRAVRGGRRKSVGGLDVSRLIEGGPCVGLGQTFIQLSLRQCLRYAQRL